MATKKTYRGDFETQRGQTKVFGSRPNYNNSIRFENPDHIIGHVYYELWNDTIQYSGASDDFRQRLHILIQEGKTIDINKIVIVNHDNPRDRDDMEYNNQLKSLPPRNKRPQRNTRGRYRYG